MVDVAHKKGDNAPLFGSLTEDAHAGDFLQATSCVLSQIVLVGGNAVHAKGRNVIKCAGQTCGADVVGRAGFELEGQLVERGALEGDVLNHLAAALVGGQAVEPVFLAVEHADARGTVDLVAGEDVEVGVERLHVDGHVGDALGTVHQHGDAVGMGGGYHFAHGVHRAEDVADVRHADEARAVGEEPLVFIQQQLAAVVHGDDAELDALAHLQQLPGNDVAVMLHGGDDDLVALAEEGFAEAGGEQVDALRGAASEDDFVGAASVDEAADSLAASFVEFSSLLRKEVNAAMDVGVDAVVLVGDGINHTAGLLGSSAVVQVDQWLAINSTGENRKISPYLFYIIHNNNN